MRRITIAVAAVLGALSLLSCSRRDAVQTPQRVVLAYVYGVDEGLPDPSLMTHINYAFGGVSEDFSSLEMNSPDDLDKVVSLKKKNPSLKVLLSVGGWGAGRFSEMASDPARRESFAASCSSFASAHNLDGIDIDWEYPGSDMAGISASGQDTENFTLLMKDLRQALGKDKLLTFASACDADHVNFPEVLPYVDFVNVMSYDMGFGHRHHSSLFRSEISGDFTADEAVKAHIRQGVPASMIVMGMPFYGRGSSEYEGWGVLGKREGDMEVWDDVAKVPYYADARSGELLYGFENEKSLSEKCSYIKANGLLGGMYWSYTPERIDFARAVWDNLGGERNLTEVLVLTERGGQHGSFTDAALAWLRDNPSLSITEINSAKVITGEYLSHFDLMIQLDFPPYTWPERAEDAFVNAIEEGTIGWIGFHHATLLGEFDGYPMWNWFSSFMGGIRFRNYIAAKADGTVHVEDPSHPVLSGVEGEFVLRDDEWYTYDKNPRDNPSIHVIASVDEDSYNPPSDIRMGDHPVIWTNTAVGARNVYFQFGHSGVLFESGNFTALFSNAIKWASGK